MSIDDRTTARGLARYAREYYVAAEGADGAIRNWRGIKKPLHKRQELFRTAPAPVMFLLAHSIEAALKAYLRKHGFSVAELRRDVGHELMRAWDLAVDHEIEGIVVLTHHELEVLKVMSDLHVSTQLRFPQTGSKMVPLFDPLMALTKKLVDCICPAVGYPR